MFLGRALGIHFQLREHAAEDHQRTVLLQLYPLLLQIHPMLLQLRDAGPQRVQLLLEVGVGRHLTTRHTRRQLSQAT